ncbi:terminase TerL endonuclease subunit [Faecalibaculum rodentium]|uniref:terminase TerL endonuclease subunit n=2 Tax=Faecalibaculum rodentium TaxID=1702221 RepID=UPI0034E48849
MMENCKTPLPDFVVEYFQLMDAEPQHFCKQQWQLRKIIESVFKHERLRIDTERYEKYIGLGKYLGFGRGYEWERYLTGLFLCTYREDGRPRWNRILVYMGRGGGKSGLIAWWALALISPYNPVPEYNVDVGAFNEEQALRPVIDVRKALNRHETKMRKFFKWTLECITGKQTGAELKGYANNSRGLDGLRPGIIMLDEIHAYENNATIEVFKSALGKHPDPRQAYFTTEGYTQDGPLDDMIKLANKELTAKDTSSASLWYICKLDREEEAHDEDLWHKANPSLIYKPDLVDTLREQYRDWKNAPGHNLDFICKRMNIKKNRQELAVTAREKLMATAKELPDPNDMQGWECTAGIDFSKTTDWTAINLHFRRGEERYDINHAWICAQSADLWRLRCPYQDWAEQGLVTVVDEPEIPQQLLMDYLTEAMYRYTIKAVAIDDYRYALLAKGLESLGFSKAQKNLVMVRPSDIMRVVPIIDRCFSMELFHWGENPVLRWATNNTSLIPSKKSVLADSGELQNGNFLYGKQEPHARKTDPFMALVASMVVENQIMDPLPDFDDEEMVLTF